MLNLIFNIDDSLYAFSIANIIEIIPLVTIKPLNQAPEAIKGVFNYRGSIIPVIDLTYVISKRYSQELLSTRIIIVNFTTFNGNESKMGIIVEHATETELIDENEFQNHGLDIKETPFLAGMMLKGNVIMQKVIVNKLLSNDVQKELFTNELLNEF